MEAAVRLPRLGELSCDDTSTTPLPRTLRRTGSSNISSTPRHVQCEPHQHRHRSPRAQGHAEKDSFAVDALHSDWNPWAPVRKGKSTWAPSIRSSPRLARCSRQSASTPSLGSRAQAASLVPLSPGRYPGTETEQDQDSRARVQRRALVGGDTSRALQRRQACEEDGREGKLLGAEAADRQMRRGVSADVLLAPSSLSSSGSSGLGTISSCLRSRSRSEVKRRKVDLRRVSWGSPEKTIYLTSSRLSRPKLCRIGVLLDALSSEVIRLNNEDQQCEQDVSAEAAGQSSSVRGNAAQDEWLLRSNASDQSHSSNTQIVDIENKSTAQAIDEMDAVSAFGDSLEEDDLGECTVAESSQAESAKDEGYESRSWPSSPKSTPIEVSTVELLTAKQTDGDYELESVCASCRGEQSADSDADVDQEHAVMANTESQSANEHESFDACSWRPAVAEVSSDGASSAQRDSTDYGLDSARASYREHSYDSEPDNDQERQRSHESFPQKVDDILCKASRHESDDEVSELSEADGIALVSHDEAKVEATPREDSGASDVPQKDLDNLCSADAATGNEPACEVNGTEHEAEHGERDDEPTFSEPTFRFSAGGSVSTRPRYVDKSDDAGHEDADHSDGEHGERDAAETYAQPSTVVDKTVPEAADHSDAEQEQELNERPKHTEIDEEPGNSVSSFARPAEHIVLPRVTLTREDSDDEAHGNSVSSFTRQAEDIVLPRVTLTREDSDDEASELSDDERIAFRIRPPLKVEDRENGNGGKLSPRKASKTSNLSDISADQANEFKFTGLAASNSSNLSDVSADHVEQYKFHSRTASKSSNHSDDHVEQYKFHSRTASKSSNHSDVSADQYNSATKTITLVQELPAQADASASVEDFDDEVVPDDHQDVSMGESLAGTNEHVAPQHEDDDPQPSDPEEEDDEQDDSMMPNPSSTDAEEAFPSSADAAEALDMGQFKAELAKIRQGLLTWQPGIPNSIADARAEFEEYERDERYRSVETDEE